MNQVKQVTRGNKIPVRPPIEVMTLISQSKTNDHYFFLSFLSYITSDSQLSPGMYVPMHGGLLGGRR